MTVYRRKKKPKEDPPEQLETKSVPAPEPVDDMMYPPSPTVEDSVTLDSPDTARAALISINLENNTVAVSVFSEDDVPDPIYSAYALWLSTQDNRDMRGFVHTIIGNDKAISLLDRAKVGNRDFRALGQK